jgi:predicted DNA-binding transcriptional regulator YafY
MENKEMSQDKDNKIIKSCREALRERTRRAYLKKALRLLDKAGTEDPRPGDEMPDEKRAHIDQALDSMLRKAIRSKHLIRFSYKNQERIAEPHDYGIQNGIARLFCYQVGGRSGGRIPGWRLVNVSEMQNCEMLQQTFAGNRETPSGKHHYWNEVFVRVEAPQAR